MSPFLLDTGILSDLVRKPQGKMTPSFPLLKSSLSKSRQVEPMAPCERPLMRSEERNDPLFAAQALVLDSVVVTANQREFSRVPGLKVQNWLRG